MTNHELTKQKKSPIKEYGMLILWTVAFFVLLLLRDAYSVTVNKYILLALACVSVVTLSTDKVIGLYCFLFPLYVGLPGNYMTLLLIARLLVDMKNLRFKATSFLLTLCVGAFVLCQNLFLGQTGIVQMVLIAGVAVILLLFSYKGDLNKIMLVLMFSAGVAALGYIMLTATLQVYELSDLMSSYQRLGADSTDYVSSTVMNVSIDPNFYGAFAIAAVSTAAPLALEKETKRGLRILLLSFTVVSIFVCIVGLSRAAFLILALWGVLYVLLRRSFKGAWLVAAVAVLVIVAMPDVLNAMVTRLEEDDMATGNGRTQLMEKFLDAWLENPGTLLFGVGLFNCNVHCTPLQFLFGGGIVLFSLVVALTVSYKPKFNGQISLAKSLPFWITFVMLMTVPAAGLLNFMFPLVYVGLLSSTKENGK